ncbi:helix-turn-helix transcriptional regulator [Clostridium kluyveri]|uniref:Transcriptional regulator n=1 Tax=Clostridium kluyveri TaxID=1534 RepID=A0A1L5F973_CLOKL|nr:helix-turn-helix transcriptional regulator [Clostridium kluyveri]APM39517.1 transcriptional regulator [Clostridium kluyveri]UZQ52744.1 helix-turn-helix transcriptional regulator [Clostridium kluyveri]
MKNSIKELRKEKNYRQEDLATALGVTRQTINAIENNKYDPSLSLAFKLASILGTTVDKLFEPDPTMLK